jgi:DNA (cytosine-5)-methyltransferase 1
VAAIVESLEGEVIDWGRYARAVLRWQQVIGRMVPHPLVPGKNGKGILSPVFVEWMMGLEEGWVTQAGLSRNAQLKILGNGVVPQQAALALAVLLRAYQLHEREEEAGSVRVH